MPKKKSFINDNPALAFITGAGEQPQQPDTAPEIQEPPTIRLPGTEPEQTAPQSFAAFRPKKPQIERKTKRYNLLIQPSLFARVQAAAEEAGISVNDTICQTLAAAFPE